MDKIINEIQKVRSKNNKLWMDLLKLAIEVSPKKAKKIIEKINHNDMIISQLLGKIK